MKRVFFSVSLAIAVSAPSYYSVVLAGSVQSINPFKVESRKCQAKGTKGCTIYNTDCLKAPNNYQFDLESLVVQEGSHSGKKTFCQMTPKKTMLKISNGDFEVDAEIVKEVCVYAHAESGSGKYGATAWTECELKGNWKQFSAK